MRILAVLAFSILYLSANVAATVEMTEARLAGESDAKNPDNWNFRRFAAGCFVTATPMVILSALLVGDVYFDTSYSDNLDPGYLVYPCILSGIGGLLTIGDALTHAPAPPVQRLLGKSPDWVNAYTEAYQKSIKRYNAKITVEGFLTGTAISACMFYSIVDPVLGGHTYGGN